MSPINTAAFVRALHAGEKTQQRRLSRSRWTGHHRHSSERDLEIDMVERGHEVTLDRETSHDAADIGSEPVLAKRDRDLARGSTHHLRRARL